ncbi:hypothetical protein HGRIS_007123 [Hohenbuehelia grisea]|uniref:Uncharacterized protein n=1 Tax=Hohenbuehelia grisea TaxID=104357 RepID=A0ABR3JB40_9AGAR
MGSLNRFQQRFVDVLCASTLYGVFATLIAVIVYLLLSDRRISVAHRALFWVSIFMFALVTVHLGLELQQATQADAVTVQTIQAESIIVACLIAIGDSILVWRVWVVWARSYWIAAIPFVLTIATWVLSMVSSAEITNAPWVLLIPRFSQAISALYLANTVSATGLIIGRVLYIQRSVHSISGSSHRATSKRYTGALLLIVESGLVWTLCQIIGLILANIKNIGVTTMLNLQVPLIGIMPTMIILIVHFDLVPGTHANETYQATMRSGFQAASGSVAASSGLTYGTSQKQKSSNGHAKSELDPWKAASRSQTSTLGPDLEKAEDP